MAQLLFIQMDTITGESTNQFHRNEIDVLNWSWITNQSASPPSGDSRAPVRIIPPFLSFLHYIDKASPDLMLKSFTAEHLKKAVLSAQLQDSTTNHPTDFLKITMEEVIVRYIEPSGAAGSDRMTERVTLSFGKITEEYTRVTSTGASETIKKGFDFTRNQPV